MNKVVIVLSLIFSIQLYSQGKINVLILQNEYAHDVDAMTLVFENVLNNTGNCAIDIFFVRESEDWNKFEYKFDDYELVITSRLGNDMPAKTYQKALYDACMPYTQFSVKNIQEEYELLSKIGIEFTMKPTEMGTTKYAIFDSTYGNKMMIVEML